MHATYAMHQALCTDIDLTNRCRVHAARRMADLVISEVGHRLKLPRLAKRQVA